jgi:serine/threonine-protein kinase
MTDAAVAMGRVVASRYVLGRVLGSGAMGTVRAAFDLEGDQEVAIKFVSTDELSREEIAERFRREVSVAARLKSAHAVPVLDVGALPDGTPFMVMELLKGRGLDHERELRGVIPVDEAVGYILSAIEVLAEAHAAGFVHRDVKPANIFLEERDGAPRLVRVLDFGVSKSASELASTETAITQSGVIMGSPLYMAPEQLRASHAVDARADIYSLGSILFELVTGCTAHEGATVAEICAALLRDPPRRITDLAGELPHGFAEVVMRCLEPDPKRRYANVAELGAALLPFALDGAMHVVRARRVLADVVAESTAAGERAPASDSPVTLEAGIDTKESGVRLAPRAALDSTSEPGYLEGFRVARVTVALGLVAIGIVTAVVVVPHGERSRSATRPPAATVAPPPAVAPSPTVAPPATAAPTIATPDGPRSILASAPNPALSASAPPHSKAKHTRRKTGVTRKAERP